jgi:hypothetical protein
MPILHLIVGDRVQIGAVTVKIAKAVGEYVDVRVDGADSGTIEINPDEHPDEEVAASASDPNAAGRTIGSRLPGGVR